MARQHRRPDDPRRPTAHLYIANCGDHVGVGENELRSLLDAYGRVEDVSLVDGSSHAFVTMESVEAATGAIQSLQHTPIERFGGRRLYLEFSELREVKPPKVPCSDILNVDIRARIPEVPGLSLFLDFITPQEEQTLLKTVLHQEWSVLSKRRVQHYGYAFDYTKRMIDTTPIERTYPPVWETTSVCDRVASTLEQRTGWIPNQMTANEYPPGTGISPHVDSHASFEDGIASLSLGSLAVMVFERKGQRVEVALPRRSLVLLSGTARYGYTHFITKRKNDRISGLLQQRSLRISLTFRRVKQVHTCSCAFPDLCDNHVSDAKAAPTSEDAKQTLDAAHLEKTYVHQFYNDPHIARHFSNTRYKPWPQVAEFIQGQPTTALVYDIGCGNGKYRATCKEMGQYWIGVDISSAFAAIVSGDGGNALVGNVLELPLRSHTADAVLSIAVMHHLSTPERRLQYLSELMRILKPGGKAMVVAWAMEQEETSRRHFENQDVMVTWELQSDSTTPDNLYFRYCHMYTESDIRSLLSQLPHSNLIELTYTRSNWCFVLEHHPISSS